MTALFIWRITPWLRWHRPGWGTVYLMRSGKRPGLFKVGFTKRRTKDRRTELNRVGRDDMRIVFTVAMPLARQCERAMLRRLRGGVFRRKRDRRGTEWFWLRKQESIDDIAALLHRTALVVRRVGKLKLSWPAGAEIRTFDGCPRRHPNPPTPRESETRP
ncbi:GIY-YIG nuclease family protein [Ruegeria atlantica]|uniref:GIY-YIG nuclease family protein n=1 Tax=Ruegeria atlantica TaxID=81569 RepID=UPI00147A92EF|nr:GIY-YIG nuclease family protein [Ruegeria atlantica]